MPLITLLLILFLTLPSGLWAAETESQFRASIEAMKLRERGPFSRIRWFCRDGQILAPGPYACREFGGGSQHGEWSPETRALRDAGYLVANFYSDLDLDAFLARSNVLEQLGQMLIEQYLIRADDGWILYCSINI